MTSIDPIRRSRIHRIAVWTVTVLLVVTGVYLSWIRLFDAEWLSRAGCLIVMLGIWSGLGGIIQERLLGTRLRWRRRNALMRARIELEARGSDEETIERSLDEVNQRFDERAAELTHTLRLSLGIQEVALLLTGTFLWGFGDLLVR